MANLVLAFGEILVGAIILDAGIKGDSIPNVIKGQATQHPLSGATSTAAAGGTGVPAVTSIRCPARGPAGLIRALTIRSARRDFSLRLRR